MRNTNPLQVIRKAIATHEEPISIGGELAVKLFNRANGIVMSEELYDDVIEYIEINHLYNVKLGNAKINDDNETSYRGKVLIPNANWKGNKVKLIYIYEEQND